MNNLFIEYLRCAKYKIILRNMDSESVILHVNPGSAFFLLSLG